MCPEAEGFLVIYKLGSFMLFTQPWVSGNANVREKALLNIRLPGLMLNTPTSSVAFVGPDIHRASF